MIEIVNPLAKPILPKPRMDTFNPFEIPWQARVLQDLNNPKKFNWSRGTQVVVLSGAVGSAKSTLAAHIAWLHALKFPKAHLCLTRLDRQRLKNTSIQEFKNHRPKGWKLIKPPVKPDNKSILWNDSELSAKFPNESLMYGMYFGDDDYERFKSMEFSFCHLEEGSENDSDEIFKMLMQRTRWLSVPERMVLITTNPGEPDHWINRTIITKAGWVNGEKQLDKNGNEVEDLNYDYHVYYSITQDNKFFMETGYAKTLMKTYNVLEQERYINGKWISIYGKGIYFAYTADHFLKTEDYKIDLRYPIHISFDFNTALNKPMSCVLFQYIQDTFHFFDEVVLQGNTHQIMEELMGLEYNGVKLFDLNPPKFIINGDAAGWAKMSASNSFCDYDIIRKFLDQYPKKINYKIQVARSNPEVKQRHNTVNAYLMNGLGESRIKIYRSCKVLDEGMRLTRLKDSARYIERDEDYFQHITTAAGYGICESIKAPAGLTVLKRG